MKAPFINFQAVYMNFAVENALLITQLFELAAIQNKAASSSLLILLLCLSL